MVSREIKHKRENKGKLSRVIGFFLCGRESSPLVPYPHRTEQRCFFTGVSDDTLMMDDRIINKEHASLYLPYAHIIPVLY